MQLSPVAELSERLRHIVDLDERATGQLMQAAISECEALLDQPNHMSFVEHFASKDSALYGAYLESAWQHELKLLMAEQGGLHMI